MFMAACVLAYIGQTVLAAAVLTADPIVALVGIAMALLGLLFLAGDWLEDHHANGPVEKAMGRLRGWTREVWQRMCVAARPCYPPCTRALIRRAAEQVHARKQARGAQG